MTVLHVLCLVLATSWEGAHWVVRVLLFMAGVAPLFGLRATLVMWSGSGFSLDPPFGMALRGPRRRYYTRRRDGQPGRTVTQRRTR